MLHKDIQSAYEKWIKMIISGVFPCPVCNSAWSKFLLEKKGNNADEGSITLYSCAFCDTVYLGSDNQVEYDEQLYAYYEAYQGKNKEEIFNPLTRKSYCNVLRLFDVYGGGKSILDVGCGKGDFVDAAIDEGYNAEGIELSPLAVNIAQGFGLPVSNMDFFSSDIKDSSKDIVTMFEVIEHLSNPVHFLDRAAQVVKPGGLIYLTTPNFNSLDRRVLSVKWNAIHREHLVYFTPATLLKLIHKNTGLTVLHIESKNISSQLINHYKRIGDRFKIKRNDQYVSKIKQHKINSESIDYIRIQIDKSPYMRFIKQSSNLLLNVTSLGSTIVILLRRRW